MGSDTYYTPDWVFDDCDDEDCDHDDTCDFCYDPLAHCECIDDTW